MFNRIIKGISIIASLLIASPAVAQLSIEECQRLARENYPLIKRYDLITSASDFTIKNINKGYLPQITANVQGTYQSDVATLPAALSKMMQANGEEVKGLKKDQYKAGLELNQIIWDGGNIRARKNVERLDRDANTAQLDVDMHALNERVNDLFFGILLANDKLKLNIDLQELLQSSCRKLEKMRENGVAMKADVDVVKAEYLNAKQQYISLQSLKTSYQKMLSIFIGKDISEVDSLITPSRVTTDINKNNRPELSLFTAQLGKLDASNELINSSIRPRIGLFAQGFYGYPGYDMFHDMYNHDLTLNGMVGIKVSWNISSLYTQNNDKRKIKLAKESIENARDVFLFNNKLQSTQQEETINQYMQLLSEDTEIINLRSSVRKSAEAKLGNGIIDTNNLLQEINRENNAKIQYSLHEIEMLKSMYGLKNTFNQ